MEYENIIEKNDIEEIIVASDENGETIVVEEIGGSTSGGTSNYNDLIFKPKINGVELQGNKTSKELNINAETIEFADGETFQEKYNSGELKGEQGPQGPAGKDGTNGTNGKDGVTPTLKVGTTTTGEAGTNANVTMNQNGTEYTLNFTIPKGKDGTNGTGGDGVGQKYIVDGVEKGEIFNDYENNIANNLYSHAEGKGTEAKGENSHAQNRKAKAYGKHSHAQNYDTLAQGESSTAMGVQTKAYQKGSVSEGNMSEAGVSTIASDVFNPAHAEGEQTKAVGYASHSEGQRTDAIGNCSHSEGEFTQALKEASHSEGRNVIVKKEYAHGEGLDNEADGIASHVEGQYNRAEGEASHSEGSSTLAKEDFTHSEGIGSKVYDKASHAEGAGTIAGRKPKSTGGGSGSGGSEDDDTEGGIPEGISGIWASHAEGMNTKAIGKASHSEGTDTQAFSDSTHAEGVNTLAYGYASHTEGGWTQTGELDTNGEHRGTTGDYAHAEGFDTRASGQYSHSEGKGTVAKGECQHVIGRYNTIDNNNYYAVIVGNGTGPETSKRKNIFTIAWNGEGTFYGKLKVNGGYYVATENYVTNSLKKYATKDETPTKTSQLTNDSGFLTEHQDLSDYVKNTDYANTTTGGVVKTGSGLGIGITGAGAIYTIKANETEIDAKKNNYKPIVPSNLEYAVKSVGDGYYATKSEVEELFNSITNGNEVSY
jgi:hypothetical protein